MDILEDLHEMYQSPAYAVRRGSLRGAVNEIIRLREHAAVAEEQLKVATTRAQRFRDTLLRLAARADDYSAPCIRAHVADALEITVAELESRLRNPEWPEGA